MTTGTFTFIGNATFLVRYGDVTVLTDPNFLHRGERAYLGHGLTSKRLQEPAMQIEDLPDIDVIVLSHLHGDHWDRRAQRNLDHSLPVITTEHAAETLRRRGFEYAKGLPVWQSRTITRRGSWVRVTAMPGRHGPSWATALRILPPVMGSVLEFGSGSGPVEFRMYVSGDTLVVDDLTEIPRRFPHIHAGVFHLGGTTLPFGRKSPWGLTVTMDGVQGAKAVQLISPDYVIPVHYDDYGVFASPLADFIAEMKVRGMSERVLQVPRGVSVDLHSTGRK
ncbi:MBL fold metallo-hydrolase [Rhodococcus sp. 24CO]|uniref:MBL fold metallo-hydrolase n=1 Tax=Rhodococcus sp. 24CO TaxID=3117460 RepID=UPI003D34325F